MWRNKNWEKTKPKERYSCMDSLLANTVNCHYDKGVEQGADAILKAIQAELIACASTFNTLNVIETIFGASVFKED